MLKKEKKLELVPASAENKVELAPPSDFLVEQMPAKDKLVKLNLPSLLKPSTIPVGATISGQVVRLIQNFTGDKKMKKSCVLELYHPRTDRSFLFPLTGTVRKAFLQYLEVEGEDDDENQVTKLKSGKDGLVGKTVFITRREDGQAKKYGGNKMFNFDVAILA